MITHILDPIHLSMSSASPKASKFLIIQHTLSPQKEKKRKRTSPQPMWPKKKRWHKRWWRKGDEFLFSWKSRRQKHISPTRQKKNLLDCFFSWRITNFEAWNQLQQIKQNNQCQREDLEREPMVMGTYQRAWDAKDCAPSQHTIRYLLLSSEAFFLGLFLRRKNQQQQQQQQSS